MKLVWTREQSKKFDNALVAVGIPSIVLMENAGRSAYDFIRSEFKAVSRVCVVGGQGQNGGDAWVVARLLICAGIGVDSWIVGDPTQVTGDAKTNLEVLGAMGAAPQTFIASAPCYLETDLIVDGIFGTGLSREVVGRAALAVRSINLAPAPVVSLDLPSGIDTNTGRAWGSYIRAHATVTFGAHKRGLHAAEGQIVSGKVVVADLGVDVAWWNQNQVDSDPTVELIETHDLVLEKRSMDLHKGRAGRVGIVAGRPGTSGAAILAGLGALRTGAGLVHLVSRAELDNRVVEMMTQKVQTAEDAVKTLARMDSGVVGPGLGVGEFAVKVAQNAVCPLVLDADVLTAIGDDVESCRSMPPRVLTPHPGEAARLLGMSVAGVQNDRFAAASGLAKRSGQVVVLKGARSLIASGSRMLICDMGTPALAVGGSGDVLSGIIAALLGEYDAFEAAWRGVCLHARAGRSLGVERGALASEIAHRVPSVIRELTSS